MKKKLVASLMVATMVVGLTACGGGGSQTNNSGGGDGDTPKVGKTEDVEINGITYHKATDLTTDDITLTFFHFMDQSTVLYLADRFMELYPNIKVEIPENTVDDYQAALSNMGADGSFPDVFMYTDAEYSLSQHWFYDITSMFESDPEADDLVDTVRDPETGMGTFSTGHRLALPAKFYPGIMYADRNCFKKLNITPPDADWTWKEMIDIVKQATKEVDGVKYFGIGMTADKRLDSYYGIASSQDVIGEFGFNGTEFDLSAWAEGEQEFSELKKNGYVAPQPNTNGMGEWQGNGPEDEAARSIWCGSTGQVALFGEEFWTFQNLWNTEDYKQYNLDIVPYVVPAVSEADASADHHSLATIYFGGVSAYTEHPREAYELMKFLFWGRDGWLTKIELYNSGACAYEDGQLKNPGDPGYEDTTATLKAMDMFCPITTNQDVWDAFIPMYCDGMDEEHTELWKNYFKSCMHPICYGWHNIAGYHNACDQYFNAVGDGKGIHTLVDQGAKAADYVDEATKKFNYYHAVAMLDYFGPVGNDYDEDGSSYEILTDDDVAKYEKMIKDNE